MIKWIGQHIVDLVARFRSDVYFENLSETEETRGLVVDANGKVSINPLSGDEHATHVYENVRNDEGATIPVGTPVYSKGEIGGSERIKVGIADAADPTKMPAIGITNTELTTTGDTQDGLITLVGVYNTNLSGFSGVSENDIVYVAERGGLTITKPTGTLLIQNVGIVLKANALGTIIQGLQVTCIGRTNDVPTPLYIDHANQRVGIGATSPSEKLEVSGNIKIGDGDRIKLGDSDDLEILHSADGYITNNSGTFYIQTLQDDGDIVFRSDDGSGGVETYFELDGSLGINRSYKDLRVNDNVKIQAGTGGDMYLRHDGSDSVIVNTNGHLTIENQADDRDIKFKSDDGSGGVATYFNLDGSLAAHDGSSYTALYTTFPDNSLAAFGDSQDLVMYHSGTNSFIRHLGDGHLYIDNTTDDANIYFRSDDGSGGITTYFRLNGSASETVVSKNMRWEDNVHARFGNGSDLRMFHDGSNSEINNHTGHLTFINYSDDKDIIFKSDDGSGGVTEYFRVDGLNEQVVFSKNLKLQDNDILRLGDANDLQIYHDGSNSFIVDAGTGDLLNYFSNEWKVIKYGSSETCIEATSDGSVDLYYDNSKKFETTSTGVEVTGNINVSGSVQRQISTTHHTFTTVSGGSAAQDYWVPFIGSAEQAAPNVTHRTIAPYGGILKKAIVHSTAAFGSSAQVRFHRINNGTASVFTNDNSTDDVTTNVTADMSTAYSSVAFDFTTGNTFSAGDQIGVSFVRDNTAQGDVAMTLVWEYELF